MCSQLWSIWAALRRRLWKPVSSGTVSQADRAPCRPTCTVSEGRGLSQSPLCPLKGKPSSRAYLKALLFITGFDYEVLCVLGSCSLTELLGSVVLEFPSNWENCSSVLQAYSLPWPVQAPGRHAGLRTPLAPRLTSEALLLPRTHLPAALHAPRTSSAHVISGLLCHLQKRSLGALPCPPRLHRPHSTS